jgi:hypothetical protein
VGLAGWLAGWLAGCRNGKSIAQLDAAELDAFFAEKMYEGDGAAE